MGETVGQVYARVSGYDLGNPGGLTGGKISPQDFAELRAAFDQTSTGVLGFGNEQEAFLSSLAGQDSALAAALRNPNGDFMEYARMRNMNQTAEHAAFQIKNGREAEIGPAALEALRGLYNASPSDASRAAFLSGLEGSTEALRAAIQDPSINFTRYSSMRGSELHKQGAPSAP